VSGYGILPYGSGYWGTGVTIVPTAEANAFAVGDRKVRIVLTYEPLHESSTDTGDALNPRTWAITDVESGKVYTIMVVNMVDAFTYDLVTLEVFPNHYGSLQLKTTTLISANGIPFPTIEEVFSGVYLAAASTNERRAASTGFGVKDIANGAN